MRKKVGVNMNFIFNMSCGHTEEKEAADPSKYYEIDRKYYKAQGLCTNCWNKLHERSSYGRKLGE